MNRIRSLLKDDVEVSELVEKVKQVCGLVHEEDLKRNMEMGRLGAEWLSKRSGKRPLKVITVCNTGSLATSGYGTAIGVITSLFEQDQLDMAYYAQTTPYHQGSRLTSLELTTLEIPATMICDTMLGSLMQLEDIDGVIVGADRVVKNGDTANKVSPGISELIRSGHIKPQFWLNGITSHSWSSRQSPPWIYPLKQAKSESCLTKLI